MASHAADFNLTNTSSSGIIPSATTRSPRSSLSGRRSCDPPASRNNAAFACEQKNTNPRVMSLGDTVDATMTLNSYGKPCCSYTLLNGVSQSPLRQPRLTTHPCNLSHLPLVSNHDDILRTKQGTLVNLATSQHEFTPAYIVRFNDFEIYAELILNAPFNLWLDGLFKQAVTSDRLRGRNVPLLTTLLHLRDINEWLDRENLLACYLVQVCEWDEEPVAVKEKQNSQRDATHDGLYTYNSRIQRVKNYKSCDEAAANVFLDGYLHGISTVFACLVMDASKVDEATYSSIKTKCIQQLNDYRDIGVKEMGNKFFIY